MRAGGTDSWRLTLCSRGRCRFHIIGRGMIRIARSVTIQKIATPSTPSADLTQSSAQTYLSTDFFPHSNGDQLLVAAVCRSRRIPIVFSGNADQEKYSPTTVSSCTARSSINDSKSCGRDDSGCPVVIDVPWELPRRTWLSKVRYTGNRRQDTPQHMWFSLFVLCLSNSFPSLAPQLVALSLDFTLYQGG